MARYGIRITASEDDMKTPPARHLCGDSHLNHAIQKYLANLKCHPSYQVTHNANGSALMEFLVSEGEAPAVLRLFHEYFPASVLGVGSSRAFFAKFFPPIP